VRTFRGFIYIVLGWVLYADQPFVSGALVSLGLSIIIEEVLWH
jgi:hypothetical protein